MLAGLDLRGRLVTGDAQFCQRTLSQQVVGAGGAYFWVVKENQPTLLADLVTLFADPPPDTPLLTHLVVTQHGNRHELRLLRASAALVGYTDWPQLGLVCTVQRVVTTPDATTYEESYAVSSVPLAQTRAAALQGAWRGHWGIENRLHGVRDVTLGEDHCQVRTGSGPRGLAAVRNTVIGVLRRAGEPNIAAALRTNAAKPRRVLRLLGLL